MDDIQIAGLIASSKTPQAYQLSADAFSLPEPYGIMLRRDDPAFKRVVDAATAKLYKSAEIDKIYAKWFQSPIPPKGLIFFQAEDGIRDGTVTGVQTCALPI